MTALPVIESWTITSAVVRGQRDQLINFWLACPDDAIEVLWSGSAGQATREMVAQLTPTTFFSESQVATRNRIGEFLQGGFQQPGAVKAVIATFLLSPRVSLELLILKATCHHGWCPHIDRSTSRDRLLM